MYNAALKASYLNQSRVHGQLGARYYVLLLVVIHHAGIVQRGLSVGAALARVRAGLPARRQQLAPVVHTWWNRLKFSYYYCSYGSSSSFWISHLDGNCYVHLICLSVI